MSMSKYFCVLSISTRIYKGQRDCVVEEAAGRPRKKETSHDGTRKCGSPVSMPARWIIALSLSIPSCNPAHPDKSLSL